MKIHPQSLKVVTNPDLIGTAIFDVHDETVDVKL